MGVGKIPSLWLNNSKINKKKKKEALEYYLQKILDATGLFWFNNKSMLWGSKACENGLISNICGENNLTEMEWIIGMLDVHSDFPLSFFNRASDRQFWEKWVKFVLSKSKQSSCVVLPLGNQGPASSRSWSLCPGAIWFLRNYPSCRTGLADLIFIWMFYSCRGSSSVIRLCPYSARVTT